jgi:hypothetical protein
MSTHEKNVDSASLASSETKTDYHHEHGAHCSHDHHHHEHGAHCDHDHHHHEHGAHCDHHHEHGEHCQHHHQENFDSMNLEDLASRALGLMTAGEYKSAAKALETLISKAVFETPLENSARNLALWKSWLAKSYFELKEEGKAQVIWNSLKETLKNENLWDEWAEMLLQNAYVLKLKGKVSEAESLVSEVKNQLKTRTFSEHVGKLKDLLDSNSLLSNQSFQDAKAFVEQSIQNAKGNKGVQRIYEETFQAVAKLKSMSLADKLKSFTGK